MAGVGFKQFAQLDILKEIGRGPLGRFFEPFRPELTAKSLALPDPHASDTHYFRSVAALLNCTEVLPDRLVQVVSAIGDMSSPQAQERLQAAAVDAGFTLPSTADWPPEQLALEIWLAAPALIAREHAEQPAPALITFQCYASPIPKETRPPFVAPTPGAGAMMA